MRIHGMSLVKNEADVIGQSLVAAATWADIIYVYDNGSDDGTWEIVRDLAATHPQIVPYKQEATPFRQSLRRELFERYRGTPGDWWCILDADEFYIDDPRASSPRSRRGSTRSGAQASSTTSPTSTQPATRRIPLRTRTTSRSATSAGTTSTTGPSRASFGTRSDSSGTRAAWPEGLGPAYPERIRLKHYQYRSPQQIQRRIDSRREALERGSFLHEMLPGLEAGDSPSARHRLRGRRPRVRAHDVARPRRRGLAADGGSRGRRLRRRRGGASADPACEAGMGHG